MSPNDMSESAAITPTESHSTTIDPATIDPTELNPAAVNPAAVDVHTVDWMLQILGAAPDPMTWQFNDRQILENFQERDREHCFYLFQLAFAQATSKQGLRKRFFQIGDRSICLTFANDAMMGHLTPAFAHLEVPYIEQPELTICAWDDASTQTKLPGLLPIFMQMFHWYCFQQLDTRQNVKSLCSDRFLACLKLGANVFSMLDRKNNVAMYWIDDEAKLPYWEKSSPLQVILSWWLGDYQRQYVHGAAVGTAAGGVLIAAKGGSGKSTSVLSCLNSALSYVGDDYCLISTDTDPHVYSLYCTAKLRGQQDLDRLPHLAPLCSNRDRLGDEKAVFFLQEHFPEKLVSKLPLRAILVPNITGQKNTTIKKTSAMHALKALAPSTMFQLSSTGKSAMSTMASIAKQLPCYSLELGTDVEQIPQAILMLLETLNSAENLAASTLTLDN